MSQSTEFEFNALARTDLGKAATRRLRHKNMVPAVVYGAGKTPESITLKQNEVMKTLKNEAVYSHILSLKIDGTAQKVVLKTLERHHTKTHIMHIDFLRIKAGEKITMNIPFHFIGEEECPGVKDGGVVSHLMNELEVKCLPEKLPEYIEIDATNLELDHSIHLMDIKLPEGIEPTLEISEENNPGVVSIHRPKVEEEPVEEVAEGEEGEEAKATAEGEKAEGEKEEAGSETKKEEPKS